jgi:hypothetical protein
MEHSHTGAAELANLFRVILPPEWVSDQWGGPLHRIGRGPIYMTWAVQGEDQRRYYVSDEQAASWDAEGIDWRATASRNTSKLVSSGGFGGKRDEAGHSFIKVMLHDDGLGPSRLFVPHLFDAELGDDYCAAVPELTCAIAFRRTLTDEQEADVAGIIAGCYAEGTTPVSEQRFSAKDLWIG